MCCCDQLEKRRTENITVHNFAINMSAPEGPVLNSSDRNVPGNCLDKDASTDQFIFQQTMMRISNPEKSLDFYTRILGMTLVEKYDFEEARFSLYFLLKCKPSDVPEDPKERRVWLMTQPGALELTHNWDGDPEGYGNKGFGHIGFWVPDVYEACERFEREGVQFRKKPDEGRMKGLAFILDPDGYSIEILTAH